MWLLNVENYCYWEYFTSFTVFSVPKIVPLPAGRSRSKSCIDTKSTLGFELAPRQTGRRSPRNRNEREVDFYFFIFRVSLLLSLDSLCGDYPQPQRRQSFGWQLPFCCSAGHRVSVSPFSRSLEKLKLGLLFSQRVHSLLGVFYNNNCQNKPTRQQIKRGNHCTYFYLTFPNLPLLSYNTLPALHGSASCGCNINFYCCGCVCFCYS